MPFPQGPINLSSLLFIVPCNQKGNQVRICIKSFVDVIGTILANKGEINYHVQFKFNQMIHFDKFYTFYREQSLETD